MPAGVTAQGLEIKTVEQINAEIFNAQLSFLGADLDTSPDQPLGQLNGIVATKAAELWELGQVAYNSFNRNAAEGFLLDTLGLLTGVPRLQATKSAAYLSVNLDGGTTLVGGVATANVTGQPNNRWVLKESFTAPSNDTYSLLFESENTGPIPANPGTITTITTAVSGWNSVTNPGGALVGRNVETDEAYRIRQASLLSAPGSGSVDAIRADVLAIPGVEQVYVFENTGMNTNTLGLPPKSFEVLVYVPVPSTDIYDAIAAVIWRDKPAGIQSFGGLSWNTTDSLGNTRTVSFSTASVVNLEVALDYVALYPGWITAMESDMIARVINVGVGAKIGQKVILNQLRAAAMDSPYVVDVPTITLGPVGGPLVASDYTIGARQVPRITVVNVNEVT